MPKLTTLQQNLTKILDAVPMGSGLIASSEDETECLVARAYRGLTPREIQALLRSMPNHTNRISLSGDTAEGERPFRVRIAAPSHKWMVGTLFRNMHETRSVLLIGRKNGADVTKKEQNLLKGLMTQVVALLDDAGVHKRVGALKVHKDAATAPAINGMGESLQDSLQFDQGWLSEYMPGETSVRVMHTFIPRESEPKIGQQFPLDASASGWVIRHGKPRVDLNLASTQGRFMDQCPLYKQHYKSMMVIPLRDKRSVIGTLSMASKLPNQYSRDQITTLEPIVGEFATHLMQVREVAASSPPLRHRAAETVLGQTQQRDEDLRHILTREVRSPLASVHGAMADMTRMNNLPSDTRVVVERLARRVGRLGDVVSQIAEYGKPLKIRRMPCQMVALLEAAASFVHEDLAAKDIQIVPEYHPALPLFRCDSAKIESAFIWLFRCAGNIIHTRGVIRLSATVHRKGFLVTLECRSDEPRSQVGDIERRHNDAWVGFPIVRQIVEEHGGKVSVANGPSQATTIVLRLPAAAKRSSQGRRR